MNVQSQLWRRAWRRSRRWWSGQTRSRRIPLMAGGIGLLGAVTCCCLTLTSAVLNPNRGVADRPTLTIAAPLVADVGSVRGLPTVAGSTATSAASDTDSAPPASPTALPRTSTRGPTRTAATVTSAPTLTPAPSATLDPVAGDEQVGVVVRVIDGDTIDVAIADQTYRVRYIGIDAPEAGALCGDTATTVNVELVGGQTVRLVRDVSQTDRYDRLLRYVYVGDVFINAELIKRGVAEAKRYAPDTAQASALEAVEAQARAAATACYAQGVFGGAPAAAAPTPVTRAEVLPAVDTPVPAPTVAPELPTAVPTLEPPTPEPPTVAPPPVSDGGYNCGGTACIKGNINKGEHIYHFPGCASYNATKIDESKGERWFTTAAEAEAAGWRRALNCP